MFIADTHCDTIGYVLRDECKFLDSHNKPQGQSLQVYAMFCEGPAEKITRKYGNAAEKACMKLEGNRDLLALFITQYYESLREYKDSVSHCGNVADVRTALEDGKSAAMLSVEGCGYIEELEDASNLYNCGVRILGLTWNYNNRFACGAAATGTSEDTGLTALGKDFVKECERVGIIIDLSHASDKTAEDVLAITRKPLIASHSNFRSVCNCARNLPVEFSDEIVKRGGYIGLNLYSEFISEGLIPPDYKTEMIMPHVEYAIKNGYTDSLGFGLDIDGVSGMYPYDLSLDRSIHEQYIDIFKTNGIDDKTVEKIAGKNFLDFLERYGAAN